jgi:hypothetical protein
LQKAFEKHKTACSDTHKAHFRSYIFNCPIKLLFSVPPAPTTRSTALFSPSRPSERQTIFNSTDITQCKWKCKSRILLNVFGTLQWRNILDSYLCAIPQPCTKNECGGLMSYRERNIADACRGSRNKKTSLLIYLHPVAPSQADNYFRSKGPATIRYVRAGDGDSIRVIEPTCVQPSACAESASQLCAYIHAQPDFLISPNKYEARYTIGDYARSLVSCRCRVEAIKRIQRSANNADTMAEVYCFGLLFQTKI